MCPRTIQDGAASALRSRCAGECVRPCSSNVAPRACFGACESASALAQPLLRHRSSRPQPHRPLRSPFCNVRTSVHGAYVPFRSPASAASTATPNAALCAPSPARLASLASQGAAQSSKGLRPSVGKGARPVLSPTSAWASARGASTAMSCASAWKASWGCCVTTAGASLDAAPK